MYEMLFKWWKVQEVKALMWASRNATAGTKMLSLTPPSSISVTVFMSSAEQRQMFLRRLPGDELMASDPSWHSGGILNSWRKL